MGAGGGSREQRQGELPLPPKSHSRGMPEGLEGEKRGFYSCNLSLLHFILPCKAAAWWAKSRAQACPPSTAEGAQRWGLKPEGKQPIPPHGPWLKPSCSSDLQMAEVLMFTGESHAKVCDVHRHAGTSKLCIPLL